MIVTLARQDWLSCQHFTKDTSNTPHIDSGGVSFEMQEQLGWPVPSCDYQAGVLTTTFPATLAWLWHRTVVVSCQTEVGDLQIALVVDKQIGCLHISMQDMAIV